jgi:hypothetical protein
LIMKALEKDPARRFQSAAEFSEALSDVTGIRPSTPIEKPVVSGLATGRLPIKNVLARPALSVAKSRSSTSTRRRRIAGEAVAVVAVLALSVSALPHFVKAGAMASAVRPPVAPMPTFPVVAQKDVAATDRVRKAATLADPTVRPLANEITSSTSAVPVQLHATVESSSRRGRTVAPKLSPVRYTSAAPAETEPAETDPKDAAVATPVKTAPASAELQQIHSQRVALDARAAAVRLSVERLKSQREAAGGGLDEDVAAAYVRMNTYLGAEKMDLQDGDVSSARDHIEKAGYEVSVLEKIFKH